MPCHEVVNIHEAARLFAVAPDVDAQIFFMDRLDDLAAQRGGCLFTAAVPSAMRAIDVVEAGNRRFQAPRSCQYSSQNISETSFSQP